jgi:TolB-like protein
MIKKGNNMKNILLSLLIAILFSGCIVKNSQDSYKFKYFQSTDTTDFHAITRGLLQQLCPDIAKIKKALGENINPLYVTDFVNLENLKNHSKLGFILSDALKTDVTQLCKWPIEQIEFTKYLKIGKGGTRLLSRKPQDMRMSKINSNTYVLVGTYAVTQRQLIVSLKFINLRNGVILQSATKTIELTDEIINLEQKNSNPQPTNIYQPMVL